MRIFTEHRIENGLAAGNKGIPTNGESVKVRCQRRFKNVRKRRLYFVVFRRSHVTFSSVSLLKKCVYDLLLLTHEFLAFFQPV